MTRSWRPGDDPLDMRAADLATDIAAGRVRAADAASACLERTALVQRRFNAFTAVYGEEALADARRIDALPAGERAGLPLCGVPLAVKEVTPLAGKVTSLGSKAYAAHVTDTDPVMIRRLRAAGAIILARTTTPEFAHASFTASPLHGVTLNPWDPERTSGGSSGGAGVAVATGCVPIAEGTDMGGSIRIPAALCGCIGLKPSLGRIPMDILPTVFDSISHFGPLTRTVDDAALFLAVAEGPDDADIQSLPKLPPAMPIPPRGPLTLAVSRDLGFYALDPPLAALFDASLDRIRAAGHRLVPVDVGFTKQIVDDWYAIWSVFFAADRGHLVPDRAADLDPAMVRLIEYGRTFSAVDMRRIDHRRTSAWHRLAAILSTHDALICPTTTMTAPLASLDDAAIERVLPEGRYVGVDMTLPFNLFGRCPVISLPMGLAEDGLPGGLQIVGRRHDDAGVLAMAAALLPALGRARWTP